MAAAAAAASGGVKRDREALDWGREDEPLSKRINNLHIDPYHPPIQRGLVESHIPILHQQHQQQHHHHQQHHQHHHHQQHHQQHIHPHLLHHSSVDPQAVPSVGYMAHQIHPNPEANNMEEMVRRRELPESLNIHYPNINPSNNSHYFGVNRVLHDLHLDRLKRLGKIS